MRSTIPALILLAAAGCNSSSDPDAELGPDPDPPSASSLELATARLHGSGALRLVGVSEEGEGRDLDGDGDMTDVVLHILDLGGVTFVNTGLAFPRSSPFDHDPPVRFACNDALGVFMVSEAETGRDVDQDGIEGEVSTWTFNRRTGVLKGLPFTHEVLVLDGDLAAIIADDGSGPALHVFDARDDSLATPALGPSGVWGVRDGIVAFTRSEEGALDLNADGDASDPFVLHLYDADARRVVNAAFDVWPTGLRIVQGFAGFSVSEAEHGGLDLDGDGDAEDVVFVAVDGRSGRTRIPGFSGAEFADAFAPSHAPSGEHFLLLLTEADRDLNGDGDARDSIATLYDPRADRVLDTRLATTLMRQPVRAGRWVGVTVDESGDGRGESSVPHVFDTLSGRSMNLGFHGHWIGALETQLLAMRLVVRGGVTVESELVAWDTRSQRLLHTGSDAVRLQGSLGDRALLTVAEKQGDRNGDGDLTDAVLGVYDGRTGTVHNLRLATFADQGGLAPDGRSVVLVPEVQQGKDLNGDGDLLDNVLHEVFLDPPRG